MIVIFTIPNWLSMHVEFNILPHLYLPVIVFLQNALCNEVK